MKRPAYIFPNKALNYIKYFAVPKSVYVLCIYPYINLHATAFDVRQCALTHPHQIRYKSLHLPINHFGLTKRANLRVQ